MKITRLEIKDFQQFKDFELDLTYPAGHKHAGQPLRKVCFIGQSGTGKTTILDLITNIVLSNLNTTINENDETVNILGQCQIHYNQAVFTKTWENRTNNIIRYSRYTSTILPKETADDNKLRFYLDKIVPSSYENQKPILIYFPVGISNYPLNIDEAKDKKNYTDPNYISSEKYAFFNFEEAQSAWKKLHEDIAVYQKKEADFRLQQSQEAEKIENFNFKAKMEEWRKDNINPLVELAEKCLDVMLSKFKLRVKIIIDNTDTQQVQIENLEGKTIPYEKLSTGTKQIFLTAFSLYQLVVKKEQALQKDVIENKGFPTKEQLQMLLNENPIILFDEPENSLYPDIQRIMIDYYTQIAPDAQFFFATHSPLIASQFEPWEVVELGFDENGKVQRRKYYEGENHVDNYTIFPQYLRWDSILKEMFDVEVSSQPQRNEQLNKLTALEVQLRKLKEKGNADQEEILALWEKYEHLANLLDWELK